MTAASDHDEFAGLIRESAASYVASSGTLARARKAGAVDARIDAAAWAEMATLGWTGLFVPEAQGGGGLGLALASVLHEQLGRGVTPEPLALTAHLPALVLARCQGHAAADLLAGLAAGHARIAVAWQGAPGTLAAEDTGLRLGGEVLRGEAQFVVGAGEAAAILVAARAPEGVALYRVAPDAKGLRHAPLRLADGTEAATLLFDGVTVAPADRLAAPGEGGRMLDAALDETRVILAAELLGAMREIFDRTLDYLRTRKQFGRAIGSFQALQHRAVDLYVEIELTSAALQSALETFATTEDALLRATAASAVKARASDAAFLVARQAVQLHGAIAYTQEHDAGLFLARVMTGAALLGNAAAHRRRYAALVSRSLAA